MYYLGSRYYDPQVKRFINADHANLIAANTYGLTDKNLFSYCDNNPVTREDDGGELWNVVVGAVVGGVLGSVGEVISQVATGTSLKDVDWTSVAIEGVNGALTGGLISVGLPTTVTTVGRAVINTATSVAHSIHVKESAGTTITKACISAAGTIVAGNISRKKPFVNAGVGAVVKNRATRSVLRTVTRAFRPYVQTAKNALRRKVNNYNARRAVLV